MLDTDKSVPIEILLDKPAVLELEDIGDDDVKAFVIGIVMVQLYEYRRSRLSTNKGLDHLLLIEEAHRLLKNVSQVGGESANPRGKAVEFFCNLLAEIRSYGQGIMIADQIPTKLAPDTLKNTNLKIVHRTVMEEDRQAVGKSMNMTDEQIEYLSSLKRGYAAIYAEGDNRPKLVRMPLVTNRYEQPRRDVLESIREKLKSCIGNYGGKYNISSACTLCINKCERYSILKNLENSGLIKQEDFKRYASTLKVNNYSIISMNTLFSFFEKKYNLQIDNDLKVCLLGYTLNHSELSKAVRREKLVALIKTFNNN